MTFLQGAAGLAPASPLFSTAGIGKFKQAMEFASPRKRKPSRYIGADDSYRTKKCGTVASHENPNFI